MFPNISIIANQTAPFADLYLSGFPSQRQWIDGSAPDKLVVVGDRARQRFLDLGAPDNRVFVGGSLRFHHIELNKNTLNRASDFKTVLVSCPIEAIESLELICKSIEAFKGLGFKILINFHPASDKALSNKITEKVLNTKRNLSIQEKK